MIKVSTVVCSFYFMLSCSTFNLLPLGRAFRPTPQELGLIRLCNLDVFQLIWKRCLRDAARSLSSAGVRGLALRDAIGVA